jgi:hypothetical protein
VSGCGFFKLRRGICDIFGSFVVEDILLSNHRERMNLMSRRPLFYWVAGAEHFGGRRKNPLHAAGLPNEKQISKAKGKV